MSKYHKIIEHPQEAAMGEEFIIDINKGVWIDQRWLQEAGLGPRLKIEMKEGEISIKPAIDIDEIKEISPKGWEVLKTLGDNAPVGSLKNASRHHDQYLYGKDS